jgi:enoyl-CoA hydratase
MIRLSVTEGVATLVLSRPPVNAVSEEMIARIDAALDELAARSDWRVLHLRSDQKAFCAGADLTEVRARFDAADGPELIRCFVTRLQQLYRRIELLPQVTLAEVGGAAMGGGLELALACDLRVVALDAKLGLPEARLGLIPGAGGTQRLTRLCGRAVASRLILTADVIEGADALRMGLAQWAAPRSEIAAVAGKIAAQVAALPAEALRACKACIAAASEPGDAGYIGEVEETRRLSANPQTRERVAAFLAGQR